MPKKNKDILIIRAHGIGFIFLLFITSLMFCASILSISTCFIWFHEFYFIESIFLLISAVAFTPIMLLEIIQLFKKAEIRILSSFMKGQGPGTRCRIHNPGEQQLGLSS